LVQSIAEFEVELDFDITGCHGTKSREVEGIGTRVDDLADKLVAVDNEGDIKEDLALDRGYGVDIEGGDRVVRCDDNMEKTGGDQRAPLTAVERLGLENPVGRRERGEP